MILIVSTTTAASPQRMCSELPGITFAEPLQHAASYKDGRSRHRRPGLLGFGGLRVWVCDCGVWGLGLRGLGLWVWGSGRVPSSEQTLCRKPEHPALCEGPPVAAVFSCAARLSLSWIGPGLLEGTEKKNSINAHKGRSVLLLYSHNEHAS